ncbi:hypothetical protein SODALDRAFT_355526 [Sodiomyces alkalinus F11]|uniref:Uncharacterized protein n=1 Tax=Sodiomyces alkalinus (strain CBS 110278 / VKM F-3762 / F11) TaxID=1314773 RepID=A0A3N2Q995_SODAK|nr:hypothetical protein SODALDRAFT_355526 [Sodiomyces alkalinus F11]ROT43320.1 hypothetical protein SODALDRAFT_355526 [Sodiomyces alkalinus F11]
MEVISFKPPVDNMVLDGEEHEVALYMRRRCSPGPLVAFFCFFLRSEAAPINRIWRWTDLSNCNEKFTEATPRSQVRAPKQGSTSYQRPYVTGLDPSPTADLPCNLRSTKPDVEDGMLGRGGMAASGAQKDRTEASEVINYGVHILVIDGRDGPPDLEDLAKNFITARGGSGNWDPRTVMIMTMYQNKWRMNGIVVLVRSLSTRLNGKHYHISPSGRIIPIINDVTRVRPASVCTGRAASPACPLWIPNPKAAIGRIMTTKSPTTCNLAAVSLAFVPTSPDLVLKIPNRTWYLDRRYLASQGEQKSRPSLSRSAIHVTGVMKTARFSSRPESFDGRSGPLCAGDSTPKSSVGPGGSTGLGLSKPSNDAICKRKPDQTFKPISAQPPTGLSPTRESAGIQFIYT